LAKKDKMVSEPLLISGELNLGPSKAETRRGAGIALMIAGPNNSKIPETWNCPRLKRVLVREGRYDIPHIRVKDFILTPDMDTGSHECRVSFIYFEEITSSVAKMQKW